MHPGPRLLDNRSKSSGVKQCKEFPLKQPSAIPNRFPAFYHVILGLHVTFLHVIARYASHVSVFLKIY